MKNERIFWYAVGVLQFWLGLAIGRWESKEQNQMIRLNGATNGEWSMTLNGNQTLSFTNDDSFWVSYAEFKNRDGSIDLIERGEMIHDSDRQLWDFYFSPKQYQILQRLQKPDTRVQIKGKKKIYTECVIHGSKPRGEFDDYVFLGSGKSDYILIPSRF